MASPGSSQGAPVTGPGQLMLLALSPQTGSPLCFRLQRDALLFISWKPLVGIHQYLSQIRLPTAKWEESRLTRSPAQTLSRGSRGLWPRAGPAAGAPGMGCPRPGPCPPCRLSALSGPWAATGLRSCTRTSAPAHRPCPLDLYTRRPSGISNPMRIRSPSQETAPETRMCLSLRPGSPQVVLTQRPTGPGLCQSPRAQPHFT